MTRIRCGRVMGVFSRDTPVAGLAITATLFSLSFGMHIIFAAQGWDLLFNLVTIDLFFFTHMAGVVSVVLGGQRSSETRLMTMRIGMAISIPLSVSFWWAVNGMEWANWLAVMALIPIAIHLLLESKETSLASIFWDDEG